MTDLFFNQSKSFLPKLPLWLPHQMLLRCIPHMNIIPPPSQVNPTMAHHGGTVSIKTPFCSLENLFHLLYLLLISSTFPVFLFFFWSSTIPLFFFCCCHLCVTPGITFSFIMFSCCQPQIFSAPHQLHHLSLHYYLQPSPVNPINSRHVTFLINPMVHFSCQSYRLTSSVKLVFSLSPSTPVFWLPLHILDRQTETHTHTHTT